MTTIHIERADIWSTEAQLLIAALNDELTQRYPEPGANHFRLDAAEVALGRGGFLLARIDGRAVGCAAVRLLNPSDAEVKRMYVYPDVRGRGIGRALLLELEAIAAGLGASQLLLETGERQPEAIALYTRCGFAHIEPFGEYVGSPFSVCMAKRLDAIDG